MKYLFVYGTLMKGGPNNHKLGNSPYLGQYCVDGAEMFDLGGAPAMRLNERLFNKSNKVYGEVYKVTQETLDSIDLLEGHPDLYERVIVCYMGVEPLYSYIMQSTMFPTSSIVWSGRWTKNIHTQHGDTS